MEPLSTLSMSIDRTRLDQAAHICLFGLGALFVDCYRQLTLAIGREPDFLCDNAPEKWGKKFFGKTCLSPEKLAEFGAPTAVVITTRQYEGIYRQLRAIGLRDIYVACFDRGYDIIADIKRLDNTWPASAREAQDPPPNGKWVLVTGASRGIGRQIALAMARLGFNIVAHSRNVAHTKETEERCRDLGVQIMPLAAELSELPGLEKMIADLESRYPPIDILFNNAAVSIPDECNAWNISTRDYLTHFTVNTLAPIRISYAVIPGMIHRGFGRIVNVSSTIQKRRQEMGYACSKAALSKFVHDLAPSLHGTGVMISLVCPGYVQSDMGGVDAPHAVESVIPGVLLGAVLDGDINGRWFIAQDYVGLSLPAAIKKAKFYYSQEG